MSTGLGQEPWRLLGFHCSRLYWRLCCCCSEVENIIFLFTLLWWQRSKKRVEKCNLKVKLNNKVSRRWWCRAWALMFFWLLLLLLLFKLLFIELSRFIISQWKMVKVSIKLWDSTYLKAKVGWLEWVPPLLWRGCSLMLQGMSSERHWRLRHLLLLDI